MWLLCVATSPLFASWGAPGSRTTKLKLLEIPFQWKLARVEVETSFTFLIKLMPISSRQHHRTIGSVLSSSQGIRPIEPLFLSLGVHGLARKTTRKTTTTVEPSLAFHTSTNAHYVLALGRDQEPSSIHPGKFSLCLSAARFRRRKRKAGSALLTEIATWWKESLRASVSNN
jgi:hypothetical protein